MPIEGQRGVSKVPEFANELGILAWIFQITHSENNAFEPLRQVEKNYEDSWINKN